MNAGLAAIGSGLILALTGCTGAPEGPLEPNRLRLTGVEVAADPKVDLRYPAILRYEASGDVRVIDSCFTWLDKTAPDNWLDHATWLGDGPYCLAPESGREPGQVTTMLVSGYPGTYRVAVYVRYEGSGVLQTSNTLSEEVMVTRRLP